MQKVHSNVGEKIEQKLEMDEDETEWSWFGRILQIRNSLGITLAQIQRLRDVI